VFGDLLGATLAAHGYDGNAARERLHVGDPEGLIDTR
jgi:hypothetical protein